MSRMHASVKNREIIAKCEVHLRAGQIAQASRLLRTVRVNKISPSERLALARAARRSGQIVLGLKFLGVALDEGRAEQPAQAAVRAEYAILLLHYGCVAEAMQLLQPEVLALHHDALLAKSWCLFEQWDYEPAIPLLRAYIRRQSDPFLRLAGEVNLGEALLAVGKTESAVRVLASVIQRAVKEERGRLHANALHLRARASLRLGRLAESNTDLDLAFELFGSVRVSDALLIRRQRAINLAVRDQDPAPLRKFREEALQEEAWETVRECEFELLAIRFQRTLYERLYYGTPYPGYRRRLEALACGVSPGKFYYWGDRKGAVYDLGAKSFPWRGKDLFIPAQFRVMLCALLGDFYRPLTVGGLFSKLFPQAYFDPKSSPARVHQALKRLRLWLKAYSVPLEIRCERRRYFLHRSGAFCIRIPLEVRNADGIGAPLLLLRKNLSARGSFTAKEARVLLASSKATTTRLLAGAMEAGQIRREGLGKKTRYWFVGAAG